MYWWYEISCVTIFLLKFLIVTKLHYMCVQTVYSKTVLHYVHVMLPHVTKPRPVMYIITYVFTLSKQFHQQCTIQWGVYSNLQKRVIILPLFITKYIYEPIYDYMSLHVYTYKQLIFTGRSHIIVLMCGWIQARIHPLTIPVTFYMQQLLRNPQRPCTRKHIIYNHCMGILLHDSVNL